MKYGGAIVLIVLGAVIAFALNVDVSGIDLELIGFILMGAGAFGLIISIIMDMKPKKQVVAQDRMNSAGVQEHTVTENRQE